MDEKKTWWQRRGWMTVGGGVILLLIISAVAGGQNTSTSSTTNADETQTAVPSDSSTNPAPTGPVSSFGNGTFIVNTDIQPGTYKSSGGENCYYARLSGFGGTTADIIANDDTSASAIVTIAPTDKGFTSTGCGTWTKLSSTVSASTKSATKATTATASPAQPSTPTSAPTPTYTTPSGAVVSGGGSVVASPPPAPASWHTIETFSGQTQENTASFTIQGSQWRINWQDTGTDYFGANAQSPDGSNYCSIANLVGPGSDSTYCYTPGTYYISVNTANSWTMTVEDYY